MIKKVTIDCKLNFGPPNMTNLATYLFYWANPPLMPIPKKVCKLQTKFFNLL